jgi:dTDP-4-amino-4,6-dideoxygalactose transaminase
VCPRDRFLAALHAEGIGSGVHYRALSEHAFYRERLGVALGQFPHAEDAGRRILSIPLSAGLSDQDIADVIEAVRRIALAHAAY